MSKTGLGVKESGTLAGIAFYLLVFVAFLPALGADFLWDDQGAILENPYIQATDGLRSIWTTGELMDYWPLTYTLFWAEWQLWGANPAPFHIVNLLLHATASLLLWRVLCRLNVPGAWFAAALFAVHPVTVASAAWIVEGKNTLSLTFGAASLLCWLRFDDGEGKRWLGLSFATFVLALLAKTSLVGLPAVMLLLTMWRRLRRNPDVGGLDTAAGRSQPLVRRNDLFALTPFVAVAIALSVTTIVFQSAHAIHEEPLPDRDLLSRIAATGQALAFYLGKAVVPMDLAIIYPMWTPASISPASWMPLIAILFLFWIVWDRRRSGWAQLLLVTGAIFGALLLPVLGLVDMAFHRFSLVADHLQYAALIVPLAVIVGVAAAWLKKRHIDPRLGAVAGALLVTGAAWLTFQQAKAYENDTTFWAHTAQANPDAWVAQYNLGEIALESGAPGIAVTLFQRGLELNPGHARSYNNLGTILMRQGRIIEAEDLFRRAIDSRPDNAESRHNLGLILANRGRFEQAMTAFRKAIELKPDYAEAHDSLGVAHTLRGEHGAAAASFRNALALDPRLVKSHLGLAAALAETGKFASSIESYRHAIELDPENASARYHLGVRLARRGDHLDALPHLSKAVQIHPDNATGRFEFARSLASAGYEAEARSELAEIIREHPKHEKAKSLLKSLEKGDAKS